MTLRVLGIDPGLTRCGVGVVDVRPDRTATLVHVSRHPNPSDHAAGAASAGDRRAGSTRCSTSIGPAAVALERVFAQHNLRTVMGTAQACGVAMHAAAERGLAVALHTPSEVKAAITGYGSADKKQVQTMVARVLGLAEVPKPADAADALALAICHAWRRRRRRAASAGGGGLTPAQPAWRDAERSSRASAAKRRL